MIRLTLILIALVVSTAAGGAEPKTVTDDFVAYMKSVLNPFDFGLREDERLYPYSTRYGRRIGYGRAIEDRGVFARGETKAEAEAKLRTGLQALEPKLAAHVARRHPGVAWATLPQTAREILLDHAYTEGMDRLPDELLAAVVRGDWQTMLDRHLYVRAPDGWPDYVKNAAFGRRWIYGAAALVPLQR